MAEHISQADEILTYIRLMQQPTVLALPQSLCHPATGLLEDYADNGLPVEVKLERSLETIRKAIGKGPYSSTLSPESTDFFRKEIPESSQRGFSIILSVTETIALFGTAVRISRLALVYHFSRKPCLICNSSEDLDAATPSANAPTDKGMPPKAV